MILVREGLALAAQPWRLRVRNSPMNVPLNLRNPPPNPRSPEAQLGRVSKKSDVYSFGITLWEL